LEYLLHFDNMFPMVLTNKTLIEHFLLTCSELNSTLKINLISILSIQKNQFNKSKSLWIIHENQHSVGDGTNTLYKVYFFFMEIHFHPLWISRNHYSFCYYLVCLSFIICWIHLETMRSVFHSENFRMEGKKNIFKLDYDKIVK